MGDIKSELDSGRPFGWGFTGWIYDKDGTYLGFGGHTATAIGYEEIEDMDVLIIHLPLSFSSTGVYDAYINYDAGFRLSTNMFTIITWRFR